MDNSMQLIRIIACCKKDEFHLLNYKWLESLGYEGFATGVQGNQSPYGRYKRFNLDQYFNQDDRKSRTWKIGKV